MEVIVAKCWFHGGMACQSFAQFRQFVKRSTMADAISCNGLVGWQIFDSLPLLITVDYISIASDAQLKT